MATVNLLNAARLIELGIFARSEGGADKHVLTHQLYIGGDWRRPIPGKNFTCSNDTALSLFINLFHR